MVGFKKGFKGTSDGQLGLFGYKRKLDSGRINPYIVIESKSYMMDQILFHLITITQEMIPTLPPFHNPPVLGLTSYNQLSQDRQLDLIGNLSIDMTDAEHDLTYPGLFAALVATYLQYRPDPRAELTRD